MVRYCVFVSYIVICEKLFFKMEGGGHNTNNCVTLDFEALKQLNTAKHVAKRIGMLGLGWYFGQISSFRLMHAL